MSIDIIIVPVLSDNYSYILTCDDLCAVVDPGDPDPVIRELQSRGLTPQFIFNTHHHSDHVAGNAKIKTKYGCKIVAPAAEEERIVGVDLTFNETENFTFASETIQAIETPGHTSGHMCLYFTHSKILLSGDTLFSMGCGKLFEGTAQQMYNSLEKLKALPSDTKIYCGHEYTLSNGAFCTHVAPDNTDISARIEYVKKLRSNGQPSLPVTLAEELKTNVFLMAKSAEEFASLRALKDNF